LNTTNISNDPTYAEVPFTFYGYGYTASFVNGGEYEPETSGVWSIPSSLWSDGTPEIALFEGIPGASKLIAIDTVSGISNPTLVEELNSFSGSFYGLSNIPLGQHFFAAIYPASEEQQFSDFFTAGTASAPSQNYSTVAWQWGDQSPPHYTGGWTEDGTTPHPVGDIQAKTAVDSPLVILFDEDVRPGTGNIEISDASGHLVRTIDVNDGSVVLFEGLFNERFGGAPIGYYGFQIDLADQPLDPGTKYYLTFGSGVILDRAGNSFQGLSGNDFYFTTAGAAPNSAPTVDLAHSTVTGSVGELLLTTGSSRLDQAQGALAFTDPDSADRPTASIDAAHETITYQNSSGQTYTLTAAQITTLEAGFSVTPEAGNTSSGKIDWTYSVADENFDFLGAGETVVLTVPVVIDDHNGGTVTQDVTVTINGANDPPQTVPHTGKVVRGFGVSTDANHGVLANDSDPDIHDTLTVSSISFGRRTVHTTPSHGASIHGLYGSLKVDSDGSYSYIETSDHIPSTGGHDTFTYTVNDGHGGTATSILRFNIRNPSNSPLQRIESIALEANKAGWTKFETDHLLAKEISALHDAVVADIVNAALKVVHLNLFGELVGVFTDARDIGVITRDIFTGHFRDAAYFIADTAIDDAIATAPIPGGTETLVVGKIVGLLVADYSAGFAHSLLLHI